MHIYIYIYYIYIRAGTKVGTSSAKTKEGSNTCYYLDWVYKASKSLWIIALYLVLVLFLSLFLFGFSIAGLRNHTKAANNTASTFLEDVDIINHMFTLYKCACANIKVGMAMKLRREKLSFEYTHSKRMRHDLSTIEFLILYTCICKIYT